MKLSCVRVRSVRDVALFAGLARRCGAIGSRGAGAIVAGAARTWPRRSGDFAQAQAVIGITRRRSGLSGVLVDSTSSGIRVMA